MKSFTFVALFAVAVADHAESPVYPAELPAEYSYEYAVKDDYAAVDFGQKEERNGVATTGGYRVLLPDGRTQIVTYTVADGYSGYVAEVTYEGEARYEPPVAAPPSYPESAPFYHKPTPAPYPEPSYPPLGEEEPTDEEASEPAYDAAAQAYNYY